MKGKVMQRQKVLFKNRRRFMAVLLTAALMAAMLPVMQVSAAGNVTVYLSNIQSQTSTPQTVNGVTTALDAYFAVAQTAYLDSYIYTVNGEFGDVKVDEKNLNNGDLVEFYDVNPQSGSDISTWFYATVDPMTAVVVDGRVKALANENSPVYGRLVGFNMLAPQSYGSAVTFTAASSGVIAAANIPGLTILDTYLPIDTVADYSAYETQITDQLEQLIYAAQATQDSGEIAADTLTAAIAAARNNLAGGDADDKAAALKSLGADLRGVTRIADARASLISFSNDAATTISFDPDLSYETEDGQYVYTVAPTDAGDSDVIIADSLELTVAPMDANATVTYATTNGVFTNNTVAFAGNGAARITVTITNGNATRAYVFDMTVYIPVPSINGILSYLPAPGQFVNEGVGTGGWGDIYQRGGTNYKALVNAFSSTGVSLGAFGGFAVFDFGAGGLANDADNPYGVDFILYGNASTSYAEPGGIQVAQDGNGDDEPDIWYDIAGSRHYESATDWTAAITYADPTPSDNTGGTSTLASVPYTTGAIADNPPNQTWPGTASSLTSNNYHIHSWFPLARNYFDMPTRAATTYTDLSNTGSPANLGPSLSRFPFVKLYEGRNVSDTDGSVVTGATTAITYTGVNLNTTSTESAQYAFGYADAHPNGSATYGEAVNPYTNPTSGGDGIDISWAVNANGEPVNLASIRFVRVYTSTIAVNTSLGEVSTEICGVYKANPASSSVGTTPAPTITIDGNTLADLVAEYNISYTITSVSSNQQIITITDLAEYESPSFTLQASGGTYIYMNSDAGGNYPVDVSAGTVLVRVINQSGTAEPFITLIQLSA
jgi:hypothetical protein